MKIITLQRVLKTQRGVPERSGLNRILAYHPNTRTTIFLTGPPANVPGNITNGALGFFLASAVSEAELVLE